MNELPRHNSSSSRSSSRSNNNNRPSTVAFFGIGSSCQIPKTQTPKRPKTPNPKPKIQNHFASSTHKKTMKSNDKRKCDQLQFVNFNGQNGVAIEVGVGVGVDARELQLQLLCICG